MNDRSMKLVEDICRRFPLIGCTLTQEEADKIKEYVEQTVLAEYVQGAVHAGFVRLEPFQERVVEEKNELDDKIRKLSSFIGGTIFASLDDQERSRLSIQLQHMNGYSEILGQRIASFK